MPDAQPADGEPREVNVTTEKSAMPAAATGASMPGILNMTNLPPAWEVETDDLEKSWESFKAEFEFFADMAQLDEQTDRFRRAALGRSIGEKGRAWCKAIDIDFKTLTMEEIIKRIEDRIRTTTCQTMRDYNFWHSDLKQKNREPFDSFLARILVAAAKCDFRDSEGEMTVSDRLIRSRIIIGITDVKFQESLLARDLSLQELIRRCRAREAGQEGAKVIKGHPATPELQTTEQTDGTKIIAAYQSKNGGERSLCSNCATVHQKNDCWAKDFQCRACNSVGHIARCCLRSSSGRRVSNRRGQGNARTNSWRQNSRRNPRVHMIQNNVDPSDDESTAEEFEINGIRRKSPERLITLPKRKMSEIVRNSRASMANRRWEEIVRIGRQHVVIKIDTGADVSVIPRILFEKIAKANHAIRLRKTKTKLVSYFGDEHRSDSAVELPVEYRGSSLIERFFVLNADVAPTLSGNLSEALGLVARIATVENREQNGWIEQFPTVFSGSGKIEGFECRLQLKDDYTPVANPYRPIPQAQEKAVKEEIERMLRKGVIAPVKTPTEFVSNIVPVLKQNGKLRICLDPIHLNRALRRNSHPMKRLEQIQARLAGATVFSALDADEGFWQLSLDKRSSELCTFSTPWGRYRFIRMPFGILTASDEFQRVTDEIFCDLEGVTVVVDDILVWGRSRREHDDRLRKVLERCKSVGMVLNKKKSQFAKTSVKYLGHILTTEGMAIDSDRTRSIQLVPTPKNPKQLQQFLGMVTYVSQFVEHLADKTAVLRELTKKDVAFDWQPAHQSAFDNLKQALVTAPVLQYFDPSKPLTLSVDASLLGVGAVIMQEGKPIAYASKTLSDPQTRWAQIEREMLAIVFGCQKFHYYIYGRPDVLVETDHRPLEQIFKKPLHQIPLRLQQMRLSLQRYDITVSYRPGKELHVADFLSRHPLKETLTYRPRLATIRHMAIADSRLKEYQKETEQDMETATLKKLYHAGWPDNKTSVPEIVRAYWPYRDEIHVEDEIAMRSNRIIVPTSRRKEVLQKLHTSHCGETKMKLRARSTIYWPNINNDIEEFAKRCEACQRHQQRKPREPMIISEVPSLPWEIVSADILTYDGRNYQVIVDHYSFYWTVSLLERLTTKHITKSLFETFQHFGLPHFLRTDNGPQYASIEFQEFVKNYDIEHITSSPYYARGNSLAERAVQEAKKLLKKYQYGTPEFYAALAEYRTTPRTAELGAPSERLQGRKLRTSLPVHRSILEPKMSNPKVIQELLKKEREKQKLYYDQHEVATRLHQWSKGQSLGSSREFVEKRDDCNPSHHATIIRDKKRRHQQHIPQKQDRYHASTTDSRDQIDRRPPALHAEFSDEAL